MKRKVVSFSDDGSSDAKTAAMLLEDLSQRGIINLVSAPAKSLSVHTGTERLDTLESIEAFYDAMIC